MVVYSFLFLVLLSHCSCSVVHQTNTIQGQVCDPPRGFVRRICGRQTSIGRSSVPLPDFLHGPNVCRITEEFVSDVETYRFKDHCGYVLHNYQYLYQCVPFCKPTGVCSSRNRTLLRHNVECCDRFTSRKNFGDRLSQYYEHLYDTYYDRAVEQVPVGCPVAKGDNVSHCMDLLGLTAFGDLFESSGLVGINETGLTFFVPTNEAMASFVPGMNSTIFVGNHIINRTVKPENLTFTGRFMTLSGSQLRSTAVVFADLTLALYSSGAQYLKSNSRELSARHTNVQFLNGARVVNPDVCMSSGVTLHVIDRLLMPGQSTLPEILRSQEELSTFVRILEFANILKFLGDESRTVFAFTNDVFQQQISPDLFDCLMYNRLPLQNIALFHILNSAQYSSSLAIQPGVLTRLPNNPIYLSVPEEGENITLLASSPISTNSRAMIVEPDISASNGVVHIIDGVLFPPNLDLGMCARLLTTSIVVTPSSTLLPDVVTSSPIEATTSFLIEATTSFLIEATPTPVISNSASIGNINNNP